MMPQMCPSSVVSSRRARSQRGLIALLVGLAFTVGVSLRAQAGTTWTVCASGCDYTRIKAAIAAPTTVDGDTLAIAAGTYIEPGIVVHKSLTLQGEDASTTVVQAAASRSTATDRVFTIASGVTVTLQDLTISYGRVIREAGGGIRNEGTLTLTHSTVHGNTASYGAGGLINWGTLIVSHSTVSDNAAFTGGGGLLNARGRLTLTHSTISGNAASQDGGLYNLETLTLINTTVSGNSATDGGGLFNIYGTLTLTNSLVASNPIGGDCHHADVGGSIISHGYNLDSDGSCQLTTPTDRPGTDPLLGPLQKNGGPTLTHALLPGSPAIDAIPWGANGCGTTVYSDQRWQVRPQPAGGACDIGAYKVEVAGQPLSAWVTGLTPRTVVCQNVTTGQAVTLSAPASPWDCEVAGLAVRSGDVVALRVRGPVKNGAADVGGAVTGLAPTSGGCTNRTTGQQVTFQHMQGSTAASCVAAGLVIHPGDQVQMRVQGIAE